MKNILNKILTYKKTNKIPKYKIPKYKINDLV